MYIIDRVKGKPKATTELDISGGEKLGSVLLLELLSIAQQARLGSQRLLEGGDNAIQQGTEEGISEGVYEEVEV